MTGWQTVRDGRGESYETWNSAAAGPPSDEQCRQSIDEAHEALRSYGEALRRREAAEQRIADRAGLTVEQVRALVEASAREGGALAWLTSETSQ